MVSSFKNYENNFWYSILSKTNLTQTAILFMKKILAFKASSLTYQNYSLVINFFHLKLLRLSKVALLLTIFEKILHWPKTKLSPTTDG